MQVARIGRPRGLVGFRKILDDRLYSEWFWAYVFLLPAIIFFGTFTVLPVVRAFIMSFQQFDAFHAGRPFIGLDNYINAWRGEPLSGRRSRSRFCTRRRWCHRRCSYRWRLPG